MLYITFTDNERWKNFNVIRKGRKSITKKKHYYWPDDDKNVDTREFLRQKKFPQASTASSQINNNFDIFLEWRITTSCIKESFQIEDQIFIIIE